MHAKENIPAGVPIFGKKNIPTPVTQAVDSNIQKRISCRARYVCFPSCSHFLISHLSHSFPSAGRAGQSGDCPALSRFATLSRLLMRARYARASGLVCQTEKGPSMGFQAARSGTGPSGAPSIRGEKMQRYQGRWRERHVRASLGGAAAVCAHSNPTSQCEEKTGRPRSKPDRPDDAPQFSSLVLNQRRAAACTRHQQLFGSSWASPYPDFFRSTSPCA